MHWKPALDLRLLCGVMLPIAVLTAVAAMPAAAQQKAARSGTGKAPVEKSTSEVKSPREPGWRPVRELLADSLPVEFAVTEVLGKGREKKSVWKKSAVVLRGIYPRQEQVDDVVDAFPEIVESERLSYDLQDDEKLRALFKKRFGEEPAARRPFQPGMILNAVEKFDLQRQEATQPPRKWDELPWKTIAQQSLVQVLSAVDDLEDETLHPAECGWQICCPLPKLIKGEWGERALHPRLAENKLPPATEVERRTIREEARFVLLRYIDLNVTEGTSYRYRVRLHYPNPAYGNGLYHPAPITNAKERLSPWSEPSPVVIVARGSKRSASGSHLHWELRFEYPELFGAQSGIDDAVVALHRGIKRRRPPAGL